MPHRRRHFGLSHASLLRILALPACGSMRCHRGRSTQASCRPVRNQSSITTSPCTGWASPKRWLTCCCFCAASPATISPDQKYISMADRECDRCRGEDDEPEQRERRQPAAVECL